MNRSLEALAILVICLVGILAAVRMSTRDSAGPAMARQPAATSENAAPPKSSSSAVDVSPRSDECLANEPPSQYDDACGLDRTTGDVYRPLKPLLSPQEFAAGVIRSEPLPLITLPEEEAVADARTQYDAQYDAAMFGSDKQASAATSSLFRASMLMPWLRQQGETWADVAVSNIGHYQRSYAPAYRALQSRWTNQLSPRLRHFPRPDNAARKELLLRQRASLRAAPALKWSDYQSFADRELASRIESKGHQVTRTAPPSWLSQSSGVLAEACSVAERLLHQAGQELERVAREQEADELWRTR